MSGCTGRGELGPGNKAWSCWGQGPHLCCPQCGCSPGSWPHFAVRWKDPDRKASALTCFTFIACLWRGVKAWKPHTLYFNEKTEREVKLFHFENTRMILSCHPSTSILSVQNYLSNLTWNLSQGNVYLNTFIVYQEMPQSPGLYPPSKFSLPPKTGRTNVIMWSKGSLSFACLLLKVSMKLRNDNRDNFFSVVFSTCPALPYL